MWSPVTVPTTTAMLDAAPMGACFALPYPLPNE